MAHPAAHDAANGHHAHDKTWQARVLEIGADALTAARVKNGHMVRVEVDAASVLAGVDGQEQPLAQALTTLVPGERVTIQGQRNGDKHTLLARRVELVGAGSADAAVGQGGYQ